MRIKYDRNKNIKEIDMSLKDIGKACREARKQAGVTTTEIAYVLGYSDSNIIKFERGEVNNALLYHYYLANFDVCFLNAEVIEHE